MKNASSSEIPEDITILIVDDDSVTRMFLRELLSKKYHVLAAENGHNALELISNKIHGIDVVLTDLHMPMLDGMELISRIQSEFPNICVIVLSGTSDITLAVAAIKKGAHDYIAKPFTNLEELEIILWRWFHQQSLENKIATYARLHLDMMRNMKSRSFMALDVSKSRELKKNEDPFLVQFSFSAFHDFVAGIVESHEGRIHSTAGDGVMACFILPAHAIAAAEAILTEIDLFNTTRNLLGTPFNLRLGIHTGSVIVEKNGRINEMFSETLDIAGHIQKDAKINTISLSEVTGESLFKKDNLVLSDTKIDGLSIYTLEF